MDLTAAQRLDELRALISKARAMPMSASCMVNRGEVLAAIDALAENLPHEIAAAQKVIDSSQGKVAEGEAQAATILAEARARASELAGHDEVLRVAAEQAATIRADAEHEASELRAETDAYIDSRMASFESVLVKTASQVKTARQRLAERSSLDTQTDRSRTDLFDPD
ncbi:MAG: hypothetical protein ACR2LI_17095 [Propionibacteriaceae bacterium]